MHIPDYMIQGPVCSVTAVASAVSIAAAAVFALKSRKKPSVTRFSAVAAFIFAAQMLNFPVQSGTSGHLIGAVLASSILGAPFGILAMSLVLTIQTLVFSDGGLTVLGANIVNMALMGSITGGIIHKFILEKSDRRYIKDYAFLGIAAWFSVVLASLACSIELAVSGMVEFSKVAAAMTGIHALIGIGEAVITVAVYILFSLEPIKNAKSIAAGLPLISALMAGLMLSPFASVYPDGLEWVAQKYRFLQESVPVFVSPLSDYTIPLITNEAISTGIAGLTGVVIVFALGLLIGKPLTASKQS